MRSVGQDHSHSHTQGTSQEVLTPMRFPSPKTGLAEPHQKSGSVQIRGLRNRAGFGKADSESKKETEAHP